MTARDRGAALLGVQCRLTDRDLILLGWLDDHGVLTTDQVAHALFPSLDFAQRRLLKLVQAGPVARFRPQRPDGGSHPYHYVLADLGIQVIAAQRGDDDEPPRPDQARRRRWRLTNRTNLPHLLAVNQFFVDLAAHARTHPDTALERWWPSARCQRHGAFDHLDPSGSRTFYFLTIAADGHGIWTTRDGPHGPGATVRRGPFFVEVDLGTEDLPHLVGKISAYEKWTRTTGQRWPVLFWLGSPARETNLHARLREHPTLVPIATAVRTQTHLPDTGPAGRVWWLHPGPTQQRPLDPTAPAGRVALADLPTTIPPPHTGTPEHRNTGTPDAGRRTPDHAYPTTTVTATTATAQISTQTKERWSMTAPRGREHHDDDPPPDRRRRARHGVGLTDTDRASLTAPTGTTTCPPHIGVGLTDAQRAALVAAIETAPLPPPTPG